MIFNLKKTADKINLFSALNDFQNGLYLFVYRINYYRFQSNQKT